MSQLDWTEYDIDTEHIELFVDEVVDGDEVDEEALFARFLGCEPILVD